MNWNKSDDPFEGGAFGTTKVVAQERDTYEKGDFEFPDRSVDLFGLFLDEDIRYARQQAFNEIENKTVGVANQPLTQAAQKVSKLFVTVEAINKQAQRDQQQKTKHF